MKLSLLSLAAICGLAFSFSQGSSRAAMYYNYQTYQGGGAGGAVGNATMAFSNNTTTVRANFVKGVGSFSYNLVIFVDCAPGGFTSTSPFSDNASPLETAVSGYNSQKSVANFAPGFAADYAIVLGVNSGSAVFKLVDDASGPHLQLVRSGLNFVYADSPNHPSYSFQFDWADIGLPNQATNFFKFETSYISNNGYRWFESFEGMTGTQGFDTINFTNYDTYGVQPVPENATPALALFGGGALLVALGTRVSRRAWARSEAALIRSRAS
jgi:hypothetical protein